MYSKRALLGKNYAKGHHHFLLVYDVIQAAYPICDRMCADIQNGAFLQSKGIGIKILRGSAPDRHIHTPTGAWLSYQRPQLKICPGVLVEWVLFV